MFGRNRARITRVGTIVTDLRDYHPHRCNILIFGQSGIGKSSLVNNLLSTDQFVFDSARVRDSEFAQCTKKFQEYPFNDTVKVYDTWGFLERMTDTFAKMIDGKVEVGTHHEKQDEIVFKVDQKRIIDVIVFVFDMSRSCTKEMFGKIREFFMVAKKRNKLVYVILTKIDLHFNQFEDNILLTTDPAHTVTRICQDKKFISERNYILEQLGDPTIPVFPIINYIRNSYMTNDLIAMLKKAFVSRIVLDHREVDRQYNQAVEYSVDIFRNEIPHNIEYEETVNPVVKFPISRKHTDPRDFVITDLKFKCVTLGSYSGKYRLFVAGSLTSPRHLICGLFFRNIVSDERVYFECSHPDERLLSLQFESAFGPDYVPHYEFLGQDTEGGVYYSTPQYDPIRTRFFKLSFCQGTVNLYLRKKDFKRDNKKIRTPKKKKKKEKLKQQNGFPEQVRKSSNNMFLPPELYQASSNNIEKEEEQEDQETEQEEIEGEGDDDDDKEEEDEDGYGSFHALIEHTIQLTKQNQAAEDELRVIRNEFHQRLETQRKNMEKAMQEKMNMQMGRLQAMLNQSLLPIARSIQSIQTKSLAKLSTKQQHQELELARITQAQDLQKQQQMIQNQELIERLIKLQKKNEELHASRQQQQQQQHKNEIIHKLGEHETKIETLRNIVEVDQASIISKNYNLHEKKFQKVHHVVSNFHKFLRKFELPPQTPPFEGSIILQNVSSRKLMVKTLGPLNTHNSRWELIYRGSSHGFGAGDFHRRVDHQYRTLSVILSDGGYIFGGYNPFRWAEHEEGISLNVEGSFLFSLNFRGGPCRFDLKNGTATIHCRTSYMCMFGLGPDLYVSDRCNVSNESKVNLGSTYHDYGLGSAVMNNGKRNFNVVEIEVYCLKPSKSQ